MVKLSIDHLSKRYWLDRQDRNVLALLSPTILRESSLSVQDYGFVISAFSIAYCLGNPVWGRAIDRFGVRAGAAVAVLLWTCASANDL